MRISAKSLTDGVEIIAGTSRGRCQGTSELGTCYSGVYSVLICCSPEMCVQSPAAAERKPLDVATKVVSSLTVHSYCS